MKKVRLMLDFETVEKMMEFVKNMESDLEAYENSPIRQLGDPDVPEHKTINLMAYKADSLDFPGQRMPGTREFDWYVLRKKGDRPEQFKAEAEAVCPVCERTRGGEAGG